ncbi:MAG: O-antigen ligase family protein [Thermodesulfobacteriota bacterium]
MSPLAAVDSGPGPWRVATSDGALTLLMLAMPLGTTPITVAGYGVVAVAVLAGDWRSGRLRQAWPVVLPVLGLVALTLLGLLVADEPRTGLDFALKVHYWLPGLALAVLPVRPAALERGVRALALALAVNAAAGLAQWQGLLPVKQAGELTGFSRTYLTVGPMLALGVALMARIAVREPTTRSWAWPAAGLFAFHLGLLPSRSGYLALLALVPVVLFSVFDSHRRRLALAVGLGLVALVGLSPTVQDRVGRMGVEMASYLTPNPRGLSGGDVFAQRDLAAMRPIEQRLYMWEGAWRIFRSHPLLGVGTGGYRSAMRDLMGPAGPVVDHPHSTYFYMAACHGLVGLGALGWLLAALVVRGWRQRQQTGGFLVLAGTVLWMVVGVSDTAIAGADWLLFLAFLVGLAVQLSAGVGESSMGIDRRLSSC